VVPDSIHTAVFDSGLSYTVNFDGDAAVNRLNLWNGEDLTVALAGNAFRLTALGSGPSAIVDGAFLDIEAGTVDAIDAVVLSGSEPVLHVDAGGRLVVDSDEMGFDCLIADGEDGEALVSAADGGAVESLSCSAFGSAPASAGRLVVEGGGRFATKELSVGREGEGALEVPQGIVDARRLVMAESESSSATATVEQIGELHFREEATVGVRGKAQVRLNEYGVLIGGDPDASAVSLLVLGRELGGQGELILEVGSGVFGSDAIVGQDGLGNIQVKSGSLAEIRRIWVGGHLEGTEGVGGVYVDGSGSQLLARRMWLGRGDFGVLAVTNGGLVRADRIEVYGSPYWVTEESGGVIKAPVIYVGGAPSAGKRGMEDVDGIVADTLALVGEGAAIVAGTVAFGPQSTLEAELNLSGEPLVAIDGAVQLGGRLRVSVAEGYTPFVGDRQIIVQAASVQGAFEGVHVPIDLRVTLEYTDTTAVAVVTSVTVGAEDERLEVPSGYALHPVYPNPFNPSAQIDFSLPAASHVTLTVYDALGRRVAVLADGMLAAGRHSVRFDGANLPSGN